MKEVLKVERAINLFTDSDYQSFGDVYEALTYLQSSVSEREQEIQLVEVYLEGKTPVHILTLLNIESDTSDKEIVNVPMREKALFPVSLLSDLNRKFGIYISNA